MQKIATALDFIIYDFFIFIASLIFFGSFTNGYFPLALSIVGLVGFSMLFFKIRGDVFKRKKHASDTKKKLSQIETSLLYQTNSECLTFFASFFQSVQGLALSPLENFLQSAQTIVYPCFSTRETTFEELLQVSKIARERGAKHLIIPCIKCFSSTDFLSSMFETISIFESDSLFEKMVEFDFFPTMIDEKVIPKKSVKSVALLFFNRKKARGFGGLGICIFAFAFLSPFKTYYLLAAGILLLFSSILLLQKR